MQNAPTTNLSRNGANYQKSGLDNLRANETDEHAAIVSGTGPATDRIAAAYQESGTQNLRADATDVHASVIAVKTAGTTYRPTTVDTFDGASV